MKRTYLAFAAFATMLAAASCTTPKNYCVEGYLEDIPDSTVVYLVNRYADTLETVTTNGRFFFSGMAEAPSTAYLTDNLKMRSASLREMIFVEPGVIKVSGVLDSVVVSGTPSNDAYALYQTDIMALGDKFSSASDEQKDSLEAEYKATLRRHVEANYGNLAGLSIFSDLAYEMDPAEVLSEAEKFSAYVKSSSLWTRIHDVYTKKAAVMTSPYIDFEQPSLADTSICISLKSVVENEANRYVLLDFWASWCGPCMAEVPYLLDAYSEYHDRGFEIFGCSLDAKYDSWKNAVETNGMNWIHVSDLKYWSNAAAALYGVNSIPTNYLIECRTGNADDSTLAEVSNGRIIASDLRGEALKAKLAELIGE